MILMYFSDKNKFITLFTFSPTNNSNNKYLKN